MCGHIALKLMKKRSTALIICLFSSLPSISVATPLDLYGSGSKSAALGNTGAASANDFHAVHYNPAALTQGRSSFGGGVSYGLNDLQVRLSPRPEGYDIPDLGAESPAVPTEYQLNDRRGESGLTHSFTLFTGSSSDLGTDHLRIGFSLSLPVYHSVESYASRFSDERERLFSNQVAFSLLGGRVEHFVAQVATAYRLFDWLSFGVGASVTPEAFTKNDVYMNDAARQDEVDINVGLQTSTKWRLIGGLLVTPNDRFNLGVSYRDEQYMLIRGLNQVQVRGLQGSESYPFYQRLNIVTNYSPRQFTYAGSWRDERQLFSADLAYTLWSDYLDSQGQETDFKDTWSARIGYEYKVIDGQALRVGARWEPSPIPEQRGRSNFVDNDRYVMSLGSGHEIEIQGKQLTLSWHVQLHSLIGRTHQKQLAERYELCSSETTLLCDEVSDELQDPRTRRALEQAQGLQTGNPGFPAYSSGGSIFQAGVEVSWTF